MAGSIRSLFPQGPDGDSEFEHAVITLVRLGKPATPTPPVRLDAGWWLCGDDVCLFEREGVEYGSKIQELTTTKDYSGDSGVIVVRSGGRSGKLVKMTALPRGKRLALLEEDELARRFAEFEPFSLRYLQPASARRPIEQLRFQYGGEFAKLYAKIQFVGMSVYKIEASSGIPMERIYIPLRVVPEAAPDSTAGTDPLDLVGPGTRHVILGDPGSGKSTLLRFIGLVGMRQQLLDRFGAKRDSRLPIYVTLRRYGDELRSQPHLSLFDYILQSARADFRLKEITAAWLEYYLYARDAILLLDGLDELPDAQFKKTVRQRVAEFSNRFPGNATIMSSRIVGYEKEVRYDELGFGHFRVARLSLEAIKTFVNDWYSARIDNDAERELHVDDLSQIVSNPANRAIRDLAENPLLLTIITLVHRIDAVLPDQRVVLYQKCTETLLNTWHTWKFQSILGSARPKAEKRNLARMETVAYWMHCLLEGTSSRERSVVSYEALKDYLAEYIHENENETIADADELASEFLKFVKERAGLLIEVGDGKYSFLHLTFQEYLAATYLRKSGEEGGVEVIWEIISANRRFADARWHEVIRLLVGSFQREASQRHLLKHLLPQHDDPDLGPKSLVVGGCMVDGIEAAEAMSDRIIACLLWAAVKAETVESLRSHLRLLDAWQRRGETERHQIQLQAKRIASEAPEDVALTLACLDWAPEELEQFAAVMPSRLGNLFRSTAGDAAQEAAVSEIQREGLVSAAAALALDSPIGNRMSVALAGWGFGDGVDFPRPSFRHLLTCTLQWAGPGCLLIAYLVSATDPGVGECRRWALDEISRYLPDRIGRTEMAPAHQNLIHALEGVFGVNKNRREVCNDQIRQARSRASGSLQVMKRKAR